jgi:hypothetical protein
MGAPTRARWVRRRDLPGLLAIGGLAAILLSTALGMSLGAAITTGRVISPLEVAQGFLHGGLRFSGVYVASAAAVLVTLAVLGVAGRAWWRKTAQPASWVDVAARHMASPKETAGLSRKAAAAKARDLGVKGACR